MDLITALCSQLQQVSFQVTATGSRQQIAPFPASQADEVSDLILIRPHLHKLDSSADEGCN